MTVCSGYILCMFTMYVFTVSSCVWVRTGVHILLSFGAESFVFQVAIQKFKNQDIQGVSRL